MHHGSQLDRNATTPGFGIGFGAGEFACANALSIARALSPSSTSAIDRIAAEAQHPTAIDPASRQTRPSRVVRAAMHRAFPNHDRSCDIAFPYQAHFNALLQFQTKTAQQLI
jgi:hypothetical protein